MRKKWKVTEIFESEIKKEFWQEKSNCCWKVRKKIAKNYSDPMTEKEKSVTQPNSNFWGKTITGELFQS